MKAETDVSTINRSTASRQFKSDGEKKYASTAWVLSTIDSSLRLSPDSMGETDTD